MGDSTDFSTPALWRDWHDDGSEFVEQAVVEIESPDVFVQLKEDAGAGRYVLSAEYYGVSPNHIGLVADFGEFIPPTYYRATAGFLHSLTVDGSSGDDYFIGNHFAGPIEGFADGYESGVVFYGHEGNDTFQISGGTDVFDGGDGIDTLIGDGNRGLVYSNFGGLSSWSYHTSGGDSSVELRSVEIFNSFEGVDFEDIYGLVDPTMDAAQIAAIIDELPDGATLLLAPGEYTTPINIVGKSLHIRSYKNAVDYGAEPSVFRMHEQLDSGTPAISWSRGSTKGQTSFKLTDIDIYDAAGDGIAINGASEVILREVDIDAAGRLGDAANPFFAGIHLTNVEQVTLLDANISNSGFNENNPFRDQYGNPVRGFDNHGIGLHSERTTAGPQHTTLNVSGNFSSHGFAAISVENDSSDGGTINLNLGWKQGDDYWAEGTESFSYIPGSYTIQGPGALDLSVPGNIGLGAIGVYSPDPGVFINEDSRRIVFGSLGYLLRYEMIWDSTSDERGDFIPLTYGLNAKLVDGLAGAATIYFKDVDFALGTFHQELPAPEASGILSADGYVIDLTNGNKFLSTGELILGSLDGITVAVLENALNTVAGLENSDAVLATATSPGAATGFLSVLGDSAPAGQVSGPINVNLDLTPLEGEGDYDGLNVIAPPNTTVNVDLAGATVGPGSPALTVTSGVVTVTNGVLSQSFTGTDEGQGDFPTILVKSGGTLVLGDDGVGVTVIESDGFDQSVIKVENGGALLLDETATNTLTVVGDGTLITYEAVAALDVSDAFSTGRLIFKIDDNILTDNFAIEDAVQHSLDSALPALSGQGLVTWVAGQLFITPSSGNLQRAAEVALPDSQINIDDSFPSDHVHHLTLDSHPTQPSQIADNLTIQGSIGADQFGLWIRVGESPPPLPTGLSIVGGEDRETDTDIITVSFGHGETTNGIDGVSLTDAETGIFAIEGRGEIQFSDIEQVHVEPTNVTLDGTTVTENSPIGTVIGSLSTSDANAGDTHTYSIVEDYGDGASFSLSGNILTTAVVFDVESTTYYTVLVRSTDQTGLSFHKYLSLELTVNAPPEITGLVVSEGGQGDAVTLTTTVIDPVVSDVLVATIDWGDGSPMSPATINDGQISEEHVYATGGVYEVTLNVADGAELASAKTTALISGVGIQNGVLNIVGTSGLDQVILQRRSETSYLLRSNGLGVLTLDPASFTSIYVQLGAGNDRFNALGTFERPLIVDAGAGNDRLVGSRGGDVLLGGEGNDYIWAGSGNNIVIGGTGRDFIFGGSGTDLLIGGTTAFDKNTEALRKIQAEWTADRSREERVLNLYYGGGSLERLNGDHFLTTGEGGTVQEDDDRDLLFGGGDIDWLFFGSTKDVAFGAIGDLLGNDLGHLLGYP